MAADAHICSGSPQKIPAVRGGNKPNAGGTDRTGQRARKSAGRLSPAAAREEDQMGLIEKNDNGSWKLKGVEWSQIKPGAVITD